MGMAMGTGMAYWRPGLGAGLVPGTGPGTIGYVERGVLMPAKGRHRSARDI